MMDHLNGSERDAPILPGDGQPAFTAPRQTSIEVLGRARQAQAVRILFLQGFDTCELAALIGEDEPTIIKLLHADALAREASAKGHAR